MDLDIDNLIEIIMLKATATATFTNWPAPLTGQDNTQEDENVFEFNSFNEQLLTVLSLKVLVLWAVFKIVL